ncbi:MAG: hypothetical protein WA862_06300 [Solirubrobacterales bacterium]
MSGAGSLQWAVGLWSQRWVKVAIGTIAFSSLTYVTFLVADPSMHSSYGSYDDEGYMLIALRSFVQHGSLYNDVFTQYGPFYYEFWGGLFSLFGITVNHDGGRSATLVVWILSSLLLGLATLRVTRSLLLGLGTQMIASVALTGLVYEPMHPGGLICLLLTAIVCIASVVGRRLSLWPMALLGGAVAALILTKINVGAFALIALALVCATSYPALSSRRWLRLSVEAAFVFVPLLLMVGKLDQGWARQYGAHVAIAALAIVIVLRARSPERRTTEELWWLGGGLLAVGLATCVAILGSGTSPSGLFEGVIAQPLHQGDAFSLPLLMSNRLWLFDAIGLGGAIGYWYATRARTGEPSPASVAAISAFSILVGVELCLSVIGKTLPADSVALPGYSFSLIAFAWVALISRPERPDPQTGFVRSLLPALAVLQTLHAFPVAGSQVLWGALLIVPVGAVCIGNGVQGLALSLGNQRERRGFALAGAVAALVGALCLVNVTLRQPLDLARAGYDARVPLELPGATSIHLAQPEVDLYRQIVTEINRHCSSFLTEPGLNSFYIWTGQEPPTGYNATAWTTLFDATHQRRVIEETRSTEGLCLLRNHDLDLFWGGGVVPPGPLVRYLHRGFEPIGRFGPYALFRREGTGTAH